MEYLKQLSEESILNEYLSIDKLKEATGEEDLDNVRYLELVVNTTHQSLGDLGHKLPNLTQLKLNNSTIKSIRDLGTSLRNLEVLWLSRCNLQDLDGIHALSNLRELYLSYNDISDLTPISSLEKLEILDLEGNCIDDIQQALFLEECSSLHSLSLVGNPCECNAKDLDNDYRKVIFNYVPGITWLDDVRIKDKNKQFSPTKKQIDEEDCDKELALQKLELDMLQNSIKYARVDETEELLTEPKIVCASARFLAFEEKEKFLAMKRPTTSNGASRRASKPISQTFLSRPSTARARSELRPSSAFIRSNKPFQSKKSSTKKNVDGSSELTYGSKQVYAGNIIKNLRSRKVKNSSSPEEVEEEEERASSSDSSIISEDSQLSNFLARDSEDFNADMLEEVMLLKLKHAEKGEEDSFFDEDTQFERVDLDKLKMVDDMFPEPKAKEEEATQQAIDRSPPKKLKASSSSTLRRTRPSSASHRSRSRNEEKVQPATTNTENIAPKRPRPSRLRKKTTKLGAIKDRPQRRLLQNRLQARRHDAPSLLNM